MKPRTAEEILAWHNRGIDEITEEECNAAARWADAHWADQPHERSVGRTYKEHTYTAQDGRYVWTDQEWIK